MRKRDVIELSIGELPVVKLDGRELSGGHNSTCNRIEYRIASCSNAR
jgi:hypothetical protein